MSPNHGLEAMLASYSVRILSLKLNQKQSTDNGETGNVFIQRGTISIEDPHVEGDLKGALSTMNDHCSS